MADHIICNNPNCGFKGEARPVERAYGWENYCPNCNVSLGRGRFGPKSTVPWTLILAFAVMLGGGGVVAWWLSNQPPPGQGGERVPVPLHHSRGQ